MENESDRVIIPHRAHFFNHGSVRGGHPHVLRIYGFFGNTIDPMRGKPTNAEMIGMLAQHMRVTSAD